MIIGENITSETKYNYGFYKFPNGTSVSSSSSPTASLTITTHGKPVYIACSGDVNPGGASHWCRGWFYKDGVALCKFRDDNAANSYNNPFMMLYLDTNVVKGTTYTYKALFNIGAGTCNLAEEGALHAPNFMVFEI